MKPFLSAVLALGLVPGALVAQKPAAPKHHDPNQATQKLAKELNLTPDQTPKVEPVLAEREQRVAAIKANKSLSPDAQHQQIHAVHQQVEQKLSGILTPVQMAKLKQIHHQKELEHKKQKSTPAG